MTHRIRALTATILIAGLLLGASTIQASASGVETVNGDQVANSLWGIRFTAPGYRVWRDHPLRGEPRLVAAGFLRDGQCQLNLSLIAVLVPPESSAVDCRSAGIADPAKLREDHRFELLASEDAPLTWSRFRQETSDIVRDQVFAYWVRDRTCFELHISAISCGTFEERSTPVVASLALEPRPYVNAETVGAAEALGLEPDHWEVHWTLAAAYLHNEERQDPARARAYYDNVLHLSQGDLDFRHAWIVQEGIGLSWLAEDDGAAAVEPLRRAVQLARSEPDAGNELGESLYNLTCAYALAGDEDEACKTAAEVLEGLSGKAREDMLRTMRQDSQLRTLRQAGCIEGL